jgi:hypothetical protein
MKVAAIRTAVGLLSTIFTRNVVSGMQVLTSSGATTQPRINDSVTCKAMGDHGNIYKEFKMSTATT